MNVSNVLKGASLVLASCLSMSLVVSCSSDDSDDTTADLSPKSYCEPANAVTTKAATTIKNLKFTELSATQSPFVMTGDAWGARPIITRGDVDEDGAQDFLVGNIWGQYRFIEGGCSSITTFGKNEVGNPLNGKDEGSQSAPAFVDLDDDGDLDVVSGDSYGKLYFYKNQSTATAYSFSHATTNPFSGLDFGHHAVPYFSDIDGDGDYDAVVGDNDGRVAVTYNTGSKTAPKFTTFSDLTLDAPAGNILTKIDVGTDAKPTLADIDNDGDLDLIVGNSAGDFKLFENSKVNSLKLTEISNVNNPLPSDLIDGSMAQFYDYDYDGDLDLITVESEYKVVTVDGGTYGTSKYDVYIRYFENKQ